MEDQKENRVFEFSLNWKHLVLVIVAGVCIAVSFGLIENYARDLARARHYKLYGYPLVWRVVPPEYLSEPVEYYIWYLFADIVFWIAIVFMMTAIFSGIYRKLEDNTAGTEMEQ